MIVTGMNDIPLTPGGRVGFDTPVKFARGENAVNLVDSLLKPAVLGRGLVFLDVANSLGYLNEGPLYVGGVLIDVVNPSSDPTNFFQDGRHPASVGNGLVANLFLAALNIGYGTNYPLLTDLEILTTAGLQNQYTGETSNLPYAQFVFAPVPEPSTLGLALAAGLACVAPMLRRGCWRRPAYSWLVQRLQPPQSTAMPRWAQARAGEPPTREVGFPIWPISAVSISAEPASPKTWPLVAPAATRCWSKGSTRRCATWYRTATSNWPSCLLAATTTSTLVHRLPTGL
jgi:hypothetical protein